MTGQNVRREKGPDIAAGARYWLLTRADGSITVHVACHRRNSRALWTGPLTAEQVRVLPDYRICRLCLSEKFTLNTQAAAARAITHEEV